MVCRHTLLLSLLHFLVDGICACGLMLMSHQIVSDFEVAAVIVLYDVLAFATQPLTGRWIDASVACSRGLRLSAALLLGGALISLLHTSMPLLMAIPGAVLLGMGNSLFHVYGGRFVAVASQNDIRAMGVFVSTGAVGLAIGLGFSSPMLLAAFLLAFLTLSWLHLRSAFTLGVCTRSAPSPTEPCPTSTPLRSSVPVLFLLCLMLVVAARAFMGESVPSLRTVFSSMSAPTTMVLVSVIVMTGKAAGGFLSKWWGVRHVFFASMLLSAAVFLVCPWHDGFVLTTLFLINLSMPCTLYYATKAVPGREGWAFGLLALALLPGYLLGNLTKHDTTCQALLTPLMATLLLESLLLLCMRERRWQVLAASVVLNVLTNVPLNAFVMNRGISSPLHLTGLECMVVLVEFVGYCLVLHNRRQAFKYSLLCNTFSALVGFLCQYLFTSLMT